MAIVEIARPGIFGIVNLTEDSFSDGGQFLDPAAAIAHARALATAGADVIDLGAAASNVDAKPVGADEEIRRLDPLIIGAQSRTRKRYRSTAFCPTFSVSRSRAASISSTTSRVFPIRRCIRKWRRRNAGLSSCMRSKAAAGRSGWSFRPSRSGIASALFSPSASRHSNDAGIARERIVIDPGMGFFLSSRPEASLHVLARLGELKRAFGLPVLVSVSRKSFLRALTGRASAAELDAATLAAELFAAEHGADYLRTHDPGALADALRIDGGVARCGALARRRSGGGRVDRRRPVVFWPVVGAYCRDSRDPGGDRHATRHPNFIICT